MTEFEWGLMKARKRMQRRKDAKILQAIKKTAVIAALGITALISMGTVDGKDYRLIEETYTVQQGDTLWTIGETFMAKNTYGRRYLPEFISGIKEDNPWLVNTHGQISEGDKLIIHYWVKK